MQQGGLLAPAMPPRGLLSGAATDQRPGLLNTLSLGLSPVPVLGDILGLLSDAKMYRDDPSSRTWTNYGLTALGALPFVPPAASGVGRAAEKIAPVAKRAVDDAVTWFHGSPDEEFTAFDRAKAGSGASKGVIGSGGEVYFADTPEHAAQYGKPRAFNVHGDFAHADAQSELEEWAKEMGFANAQDMITQYYNGSLYHALDADNYFGLKLSEAKNAGKDGVIVDFGKLKDQDGYGGRVLVTHRYDNITPAK